MKGMYIILKKVVINIALILTFILTYLIQVNFFSWFRIFMVMPNLFVILVLFIGLFIGKMQGITYGIFLGFLLDFFIGKKIGITAVMLGSVGLLGGIFDKNFSKESRVTIMIMVAISTILYEIGAYFLGLFIYKYTAEVASFIKILSIEVLYNVLLTAILYPLISGIGFMVEEEYKGNKILTRYF